MHGDTIAWPCPALEPSGQESSVALSGFLPSGQESLGESSLTSERGRSVVCTVWHIYKRMLSSMVAKHVSHASTIAIAIRSGISHDDG